jgi:hypothetical protein
VAKTPELIHHVLSLLENLDSNEARRLALRVIAAIGLDDENKLEIGRFDGFQKIVHLMLTKDTELMLEIVKTLKYLAQVKGEGSMGMGVEEDDSKQESKASSLSRVSSIVLDVKEMMSFDLVRVFGTRQSSHAAEEEASSVEKTLARDFIPTEQDVQDFMGLLEHKRARKFRTTSEPLGMNLAQKASQLRRFAQYKTVDHSIASFDQDTLVDTDSASELSLSDKLKDFMRVQGALTSLTSMLVEVASHPEIQMNRISTLDIIETVCKLIFRNDANQQEFKSIQGYDIIFVVFNQLFADVLDESDVVMQSCFTALFTIAIDGDADMVVGNTDALALVVRATCEATSVAVRMQALYCIQDVLSVNTLNALVCLDLGCWEQLMHVIRRHASMDQLSDHEYMSAFVSLLEYASVLLSNHSDYVVHARHPMHV